MHVTSSAKTFLVVSIYTHDKRTDGKRVYKPFKTDTVNGYRKFLNAWVRTDERPQKISERMWSNIRTAAENF